MNRTLEPLRVLALDRPSQQASIIVDCPITTNDEPGDHVPCVNLLTVESVENDSFQSQSCADQLKALSEPLRLRIIDLLRHGEMTVGDIAEFLETEVVTVSHHLKILKHADLVEVERDGRFMVYRLRSDLLQKGAGRSRQFLNLGCCRIEVPDSKPQS